MFILSKKIHLHMLLSNTIINCFTIYYKNSFMSQINHCACKKYVLHMEPWKKNLLTQHTLATIWIIDYRLLIKQLLRFNELEKQILCPFESNFLTKTCQCYIVKTFSVQKFVPFLVPRNTQKILTKIWHRSWDPTSPFRVTS